ncbi:MAG TPA: STAS/SEC14 domain-containing protein, partial [Candidatus Obscuribacter sp.]|nr:STAS/SEC14 domain-containing protein [Candidatus Obscuribacter sp.]
ILRLEAREILTHADYEQVLIPKLEELIEKHGKARVLFVMREDFHGWEPSAMWDDAKFGMKHRADFEKCAVVGGPKWVEWATRLGSMLITAECKTFPASELELAQNWIETEVKPG